MEEGAVITGKKKKKWRLGPSIRGMLFALLILFMCAILGILNLLVPEIAMNALVELRQDKIAAQIQVLRNHVLSENYLTTGTSSLIDTEIDFIGVLYESRVEIIDQNLRIIRDSYVVDEGKVSVTPSVIKCMQSGTVIDYDDEAGTVEYAVQITDDSSGEILGILFVVIRLDDVIQTIGELKESMQLWSLIILLLGGAAAFLITVAAIHPLKKTAESVSLIAEGSLDDELPEQTFKETEAIEEPIRKLLNRLRQLEETRQEFVSNVSHELKTPIASMKVLADSLLLQEDVPPELYREFLSDIVTELDRENEIVTDLLTMVKLDRNHAVMNFEQYNLNDMVEAILKRLRPIAAQKNVELTLESFRPVIAEVDESRLSMAITNLVENAIKYNVIDGRVRVSLNADHRHAYIKVADTGIGIPEEKQAMVFERFYRVDKARSRESGGTGLGLAIAKDVISLHGGEIRLYSREGEGTTFTVQIPLAHAAQEKSQG
ncbi:MAG: cell wall metabolism sensor histidine kinase WalK [Lachnospiraceae bacterium]|nr:cell wall metabolism sensor histidine kinase WalK [Lachnospiraceae bacterium]